MPEISCLKVKRAILASPVLMWCSLAERLRVLQVGEDMCPCRLPSHVGTHTKCSHFARMCLPWSVIPCACVYVKKDTYGIREIY